MQRAKVAIGRLQVLGGAYLVPTLRLNAPVRVDGQYDMHRLVQDSHTSWNLRGPVILDLENVSSNGSPHNSPIRSSELRSLLHALKGIHLYPIGITNASQDVKTMAWNSHQLPSLIGTRMDEEQSDGELTRMAMNQLLEEAIEKEDSTANIIEERIEPATTNAETPLKDEKTNTLPNAGMMLVEGSVRTGQQVYAKDQGLIVMGSVHSGAEVLADGDIHVYGTLKGRALAGIGGNNNAKVFAQKFDAELISIADTFTTCDELEARELGTIVEDKPTIIWLENSVLRFKSIVPGP
ncbi:hypothetical protein THRCLA_07850 [Thraustotheca clavata]|uniref:Septum formation inhibitor MinC C-terminal domain-containing protein n=1 Tax=Thraustotheca clavata TaxID=74557 RepID=A0A1V9ZBU1_9STRA|nr:hypothetical protein THRCLA_07850 [Thraustotheca clavata]